MYAYCPCAHIRFTRTPTHTHTQTPGMEVIPNPSKYWSVSWLQPPDNRRRRQGLMHEVNCCRREEETDGAITELPPKGAQRVGTGGMSDECH